MKKYCKIFATATLMALATMSQSCLEMEDDNINVVCNLDCTTIEGRITTDDGSTPIKNVALEFDGRIPAGWGLGSKRRKIATTKTDENGNYKIEFYANDEEIVHGSFVIAFDVPDDTYLTQQSDSHFFISGIKKRDTIVTRNYHIPRKGGLIVLKIRNPQDIAEDEGLNSNVSYKFDDLTKNIQYVPGFLFSDKASELRVPTAANQFSYISTSKKKSGEYFSYLDSIIVGVDQTIVYEIEF